MLGGDPVGVLLRDRLALLGEAEGPVERSGRQGPEEAMGRPCTAADRATSTVEEADRDAHLGTDPSQGFLGAVQTPEARQDAAVLVAVAVADHHLLTRWPLIGGTCAERAPRDRVFEECSQDLGAPLQIIDRLEQGDHRQQATNITVLPAQQARFLGEQVDDQQVRHAAGHRHDETADSCCSVRSDFVPQHPIRAQHRRRPRARSRLRRRRADAGRESSRSSRASRSDSPHSGNRSPSATPAAARSCATARSWNRLFCRMSRTARWNPNVWAERMTGATSCVANRWAPIPSRSRLTRRRSSTSSPASE